MYPDETPHYKEVEDVPIPVQKEMALLRRAALQRLGVLGVIFVWEQYFKCYRSGVL